ncbi:MAG: electron transport complex subunit RsxE [Pseudomonadales bacterium]|jgi:electron transport complex protein RnfE|nr:electron transport complex subunit RsxE [Pseudomonadales bacterium]
MTATATLNFNSCRDKLALTPLLGLCPLLAVSNSAISALTLGLCTLSVLLGSSFCISLLRNRFTPALRLPAYMLIIASFTSCAEFLLQAYSYALAERLGLFLPLIVSNCLILGHAESFASKTPPLHALRDALGLGLSFILVLLVLGMLREALGSGRLFTNMDLLLPFATNWEFICFNSPPFPLALTPSGAFLLLAFLIAFKNYFDQRPAQHQPAPEPEPAGSKRVRVTGQV